MLIHWKTLGLAAVITLAGAGCTPIRRSIVTLTRQDLMVINEKNYRAWHARLMRLHLKARRFDRLESIADSLDRTDPRWPSGSSVLLSFYQLTFGRTGSADGSAWEDHLSRLREWMEERPTSTVARFALAEALIGRAWEARGTGWASSVSRDEGRRFEADLAEARGILMQCPPETRAHREWNAATLRVLHGLGEDSLYRSIAEQALERFPEEPRFYVGYAGHLLPRWYGAPGDWEEFATRATRALPDSVADEFYARVITGEAAYSDDLFGTGGRLSWSRARKGCDDWRRRYPSSTQPLSAKAMLAWHAGDLETARSAFAAIGDTCEIEVWDTLPRYWAARQWAEKGS